MTTPSRLMSAALAAASAGHYVFPVWPRSKKPAVTDWEARATRDGEAIRAWWEAVPYNIGIATGRSGLVVIDLDDAHGHPAPPQWPGARHGRDVLAHLAEQADQPMPLSTYTVRTPSGGLHLYYRAPQQVELRNTIARLGWKIDTRAHGGCIIAAGSVRAEGLYRVINDVAIAPLPRWLVDKLTPVLPQPPVQLTPLTLPTGRASAYVAAIVEGETDQVRCAQPGTRHHSLLRAASALGRLVAGGELTELDARAALSNAAAPHLGIEGFTTAEADKTITDGLNYGARRPRRITTEPAQPHALAAGCREGSALAGSSRAQDTAGALRRASAVFDSTGTPPASPPPLTPPLAVPQAAHRDHRLRR